MTAIRVYLASDHAGFELKSQLIKHLSTDYDVVDCGAEHYDEQDDYPAFCIDAATRVAANPGSLGIVLGGSGNGEQIAANKVDGIRAALAWSPLIAKLAREHNDANVIGVGARMHTLDEAIEIVETFLQTPFSGAERHARRIAQLATYEQQGDIPVEG